MVETSEDFTARIDALIKAARQSGFYDGIIAAQRAIIAALPDDKGLAYRITKELPKEKPPE